MLLHQALSATLFVLLLAALGFGPAYALLRGRAERLYAAAAFAPVLALALIMIPAFPLVRYFATVQEWAWPLTGVLFFMSVALLVWERRALRADFAMHGRPLLLVAIFFLALLGVRSSTIYTGGLQHTVFQSQPADAYCYTTLAESTRCVPWPKLMAGADFSNKKAADELAQISPSALFTARTLLIPLRYNLMVVEAYGAVVTGLETYKFYHPFTLAIVALFLPMTLLWAHRLGLPTSWLLAAGAVSLFGFWPQMLMQVDALGQVMAGLLVLAIAYLTASMLVADGGLRWANLVLLTLLVAALGCCYTEFYPSLALALALPLGLAVKEDRRTWKVLALCAASGPGAVVLWAITGQLDTLILYHRYRASEIAGESAKHLLGSVVQAGVPAAFFGLFPVERAIRSVPVLWLLGLALLLLVAVLTALFIRDLWTVLFQRRDPFARVLASTAVSSLAAYTLLLFMDRNYSAMKAFMFVLPFLPVVIVGFFWRCRESPWLASAPRFLVPGLCALWIALQLSIGAAGLRLESRATLMLADLMSGNSVKREFYDLREIIKKLDEVQPAALLVSAPPPFDWRFRLYLNMAFAKYRPYFQTGVVYDNSNAVPSFYAGALTRVPDYVIVSKRANFMEAEKLGERIARTKNLHLYRVTSTDLEAFRAHEPATRP